MTRNSFNIRVTLSNGLSLEMISSSFESLKEKRMRLKCEPSWGELGVVKNAQGVKGNKCACQEILVITDPQLLW